MAAFSTGQSIRIRCEVQRGAFPTEFLVTFDTVSGPVSGFVKKNDVEEVHDDEGFIRGFITEVSADTITVVVHGSFFTTTGLAYLKRDWANSHVQAASA